MFFFYPNRSIDFVLASEFMANRFSRAFLKA